MARKYRLFAALLLVVTGMQLCGVRKKNVLKREVKKKLTKEEKKKLTDEAKNNALIILFKDDEKSEIWARVKDNSSGFRPLNIKDDGPIYGAKPVDGKTNVYTMPEKSLVDPWIQVANIDHQGYVRLLWKLDSKLQSSDGFKQALEEAKIWEVFPGLKQQTAGDDDSFLESYGPTIIVGLLGIGLLGGAYWFYRKYFRR